MFNKPIFPSLTIKDIRNTVYAGCPKEKISYKEMLVKRVANAFSVKYTRPKGK